MGSRRHSHHKFHHSTVCRKQADRAHWRPQPVLLHELPKIQMYRCPHLRVKWNAGSSVRNG
jgi:hypothetical protein